jgi:hypothetical protein
VGAAGSVGEVVGHPRPHIGQLFPEIGFQLDHRRAPHRVDAAAVIEQIELVGDLVVRGAEALAQQFGDMAAQGLMAWPPRHGANEFGKLVTPPGHRPIM